METSSRFPFGKGSVRWTRDVAANDSSKDFTVPTGKFWELLGVVVNYASTAVAGNRLLRINLLRGGVSYGYIDSPSVQAASLTWNYVIGPTTPTAAVAGTQVTMTTPRWFPIAADVIRVMDSAAIDAAADDMSVYLYYIEYDA